MATSATKSRETASGTAFATLRFTGDRLDPDQLSAILNTRPTKAWRKGERYFAGPRAGHLIGRTGTWFFTTDDVIKPHAGLERHLEYLISLIFRGPGDRDRLQELHDVMARDGVAAHVSAFWHGNPGEPPPIIPDWMTTALRDLPAEIETDFDTD